MRTVARRQHQAAAGRPIHRGAGGVHLAAERHAVVERVGPGARHGHAPAARRLAVPYRHRPRPVPGSAGGAVCFLTDAIDNLRYNEVFRPALTTIAPVHDSTLFTSTARHELLHRTDTQSRVPAA